VLVTLVLVAADVSPGREGGVGPVATASAQSVGATDPSYGTGGELVADALPYPQGSFTKVIATQGAKTLALGATQVAAPPYVLARFTADGHLDPSFSGDGLLTVVDASLVGKTYIVAMLEMPDGRIALAGWIEYQQPPGNPFSSEDAVVMMLRADGTLDPSWSGDGIFRYENPDASGLGPTRNTSARGLALAVDPDGRLLVGGERSRDHQSDDTTISYLPGLMALRFTSSGDLDGTFGTAGVAVAGDSAAKFGDMVATAGRGLMIAATGKTRSIFDTGEAIVTRFGPDGHVDGGFGTAGRAAIGTRYFPRLVPQGTNHVVLGQTGPDPSRGPVVGSRLSAAGAADASFGSGGTLTLPEGMVQDVVPRPDGSAIVVRGAYFSLISPDGARVPFGADGTDHYLAFVAWGGFLDLSGRPMFWRQQDQGPDPPGIRLQLTRACLAPRCGGPAPANAPPPASPARPPVYAGRLRATTLAFADKRFVLYSPARCVPRGARFPVRLYVRRGSKAATRRAARVKRVVSVVFSTGSQTRARDRRAPFAALLTSATLPTTRPAVSARIALDVFTKRRAAKGKRASTKLIRKAVSVSRRLRVCA
jgi:uncharacterized delta-60 repeat protein